MLSGPAPFTSRSESFLGIRIPLRLTRPRGAQNPRTTDSHCNTASLPAEELVHFTFLAEAAFDGTDPDSATLHPDGELKRHLPELARHTVRARRAVVSDASKKPFCC